MTGDVLIDTNILVYAYDTSDRTKQDRALAVLRHVVRTGHGHLSSQVLGEFFRVVTGRLRPALSAGDAFAQVAALMRAWPVVAITPMVVLEAARGVRDHGLAYWDAQVWATARLNQIPTVLTEDFDDRRTLDGVRFANPFRPGFDAATLT